MPPKKKADKKKAEDEDLVSYDIRIMSLDQLKQYAGLLQNEIEDMRKHCSFYQKVDDELVKLLKITEDDLRFDENAILFKDVELEKMKLEFLKHLHEKEQLPKYMEHNTSSKIETLTAQISNRLEQEHNRHSLETRRLKHVLLEKDRQVERLSVKIEMARRETKEKNDRFLNDMDCQQENLLKQAVSKYEVFMKETQEEFEKWKEAIKFEALEEKVKGERKFNDACKYFKQKLQSYYKEVTKQDIDTIKKLKNEIKKFEENIKKLKVSFDEAVEENKELKNSSQSKVIRCSAIAPKFDAGPIKILEAFKMHNRIEKLVLNNQILENEIKNIVDKTYNLRKQFTSALKKVRESVEMKTEFLEKKLHFILDEKRNKSFSSGVTESESHTESQSESERASVSETESSNTDTSENQ